MSLISNIYRCAAKSDPEHPDETVRKYIEAEIQLKKVKTLTDLSVTPAQ